jgi:hypothetical protein
MPTTARWAIPYPTAADSPDFPLQAENLVLSLDSMAKDEQGLIINRPVSTLAQPGVFGRYYYATDQGTVYRDNGTSWSPAYKAEERVSSILAGAPTDHQILHVIVDATAGIVWSFRYVSTEATYKWVFIGGGPKAIFEANSVNRQTDSTSYVTLGAPAISIPFAGIYDIEYGANMYGDNPDRVCTMSLSLPSGAASDNDSIVSTALGSTTFPLFAYYAHHHCRRILRKTFATTGSIDVKGKSISAQMIHFRGIHLSVRPVQVTNN